MIRVAHLLDDAALGGVTRFLDALEGHLGPNINHARHLVSSRYSLPKSFDADVLVVHFSTSWNKLPYLLALRARAVRRPIILVEHSYSGAFERLHVSKPRRFRFLLRIAYSVVDRVIAVSYGQARWMRDAHLLTASKLTIIRPFTDSNALTAIAAAPKRIGPLRLGAFGRFSKQKDFATAISAMRKIDPTLATLTIRGFGPEEELLRRMAGSLPHVTIGEAIRDLAEFLESTDAIVIPSVFEPFGQVALEARLAARPLIVSEVDGLPEQVEPPFGIVVPPSDPEALASAITKLATASRGEQWGAMCAAARASADGHVSVAISRWQALLRNVLESASCGRQAEQHPRQQITQQA